MFIFDDTFTSVIDFHTLHIFLLVLILILFRAFIQRLSLGSLKRVLHRARLRCYSVDCDRRNMLNIDTSILAYLNHAHCIHFIPIDRWNE